jgi:hypothetical protein
MIFKAFKGNLHSNNYAILCINTPSAPMYRMSILDQEIENLWAVFQLARQAPQTDAARLLLKASLLYAHVQGLQSSARISDAHDKIAPLDLERETDKTWGVLWVGEQYGSPDFQRMLFKKSLQYIFRKGLRDTQGFMPG